MGRQRKEIYPFEMSRKLSEKRVNSLTQRIQVNTDGVAIYLRFLNTGGKSVRDCMRFIKFLHANLDLSVIKFIKTVKVECAIFYGVVDEDRSIQEINISLMTFYESINNLIITYNNTNGTDYDFIMGCAYGHLLLVRITESSNNYDMFCDVLNCAARMAHLGLEGQKNRICFANEVAEKKFYESISRDFTSKSENFVKGKGILAVYGF